MANGDMIRNIIASSKGANSKSRNLDMLSTASQWASLRAFFQGCGNSGYLAARQYLRGADTVTRGRYFIYEDAIQPTAMAQALALRV